AQGQKGIVEVGVRLPCKPLHLSQHLISQSGAELIVLEERIDDENEPVGIGNGLVDLLEAVDVFVRDREEKVGALAQRERDIDRLHQLVEVAHTPRGIVLLGTRGIDREMQHIDESGQLSRTFRIQKPVRSHGRDEAQLLCELEQLGKIGVEERFAPGEVHDANPQTLEIMQIAPGILDGDHRRRLLPDITEAAFRVTAVGDVVVAEDGLHDSKVTSEWSALQRVYRGVPNSTRRSKRIDMSKSSPSGWYR